MKKTKAPKVGLQRDPRYVFSDEHAVMVQVQNQDSSEDANIYVGILVDLSRNGIKLQCSEEIPFKDRWCLSLGVKELGLQLHLAASVCWSRQTESGIWHFGCAIEPTIPDRIFDTFAKDAWIDRRLCERDHYSIDLSATWRLDYGVVPAVLHDYSQQGLCVSVSEAGRLSETLNLLVEHGDDTFLVLIEPKWQIEVADGYLVGGTYLNPRDFQRIQAALGADCPHAKTDGEPVQCCG